MPRFLIPVGTYTATCSECRGSGTLFDGTDPDDWELLEMTGREGTCPHCNGTGHVEYYGGRAVETSNFCLGGPKKKVKRRNKMGMFSEIAIELTVKSFVQEIKKLLEKNKSKPEVCEALRSMGRYALEQIEWYVPSWEQEYRELFQEEGIHEK